MKIIMKTVKYVFIFIVAIVSIYTILVISNIRNVKKFIKNNTGIAVSKCKKVVENDNHGGFHGDGETMKEYDCSKVDIKVDEGKLKKFPLSENLNLIMYGGEKDGVKYMYNLASESGIPYIEEGYYYFFDDYGKMYKDTDDYNSDKKLFDRYSFNFTLIMFDSNTKHLYYYEFDT